MLDNVLDSPVNDAAPVSQPAQFPNGLAAASTP